MELTEVLAREDFNLDFDRPLMYQFFLNKSGDPSSRFFLNN